MLATGYGIRYKGLFFLKCFISQYLVGIVSIFPSSVLCCKVVCRLSLNYVVPTDRKKYMKIASESSCVTDTTAAAVVYQTEKRKKYVQNSGF